MKYILSLHAKLFSQSQNKVLHKFDIFPYNPPCKAAPPGARLGRLPDLSSLSQTIQLHVIMNEILTLKTASRINFQALGADTEVFWATTHPPTPPHL